MKERIGGRYDGSLSDAIDRAADLMSSDPAAAGALAQEILSAVPGQQHALSLLSCSALLQGDDAGLGQTLQTSARAQPDIASHHFELGLVLAEMEQNSEAIAALSRVVTLEPRHPAAWRALGDVLARDGRHREARTAYTRHYHAAVADLKILEQMSAGANQNPLMAQAMLQAYLEIHPTDVSVICMLARLYMPLGRHEEAEELYARALGIAPAFTAARYNYALSLYHQNKAEKAIVQVDSLLLHNPEDLAYRALKSTALGLVGEYDQAIASREALLQDDPDQASGWTKYGHLLRIQGRSVDAIAAYRKSIALLPSLGEAYWSLSNLKTFRFDAADIAAMQAQLQGGELSNEDRFHFHFALGAALEHAGSHARSFEHYSKANALRRAELSYDAAQTTQQMRAAKRVFTPQFFHARNNFGDPSPDPVFIVGLPRSGSTLIEQILASHSAVEGTVELPDIASIANRLDRANGGDRNSGYPEMLSRLDEGRCRALGREYLERTRIHRKLDRPFFIDKSPGNFRHIGFIHLILPNAKIIDARREPMACCFSNFQQHFASGAAFSYDLTEIGRYYCDYVELLKHFDAVMPGRIHRVFYERLIADTEGEIRRLLEYCNLPFEPDCLQFFTNNRAVMTPSSEQVRKPIYTDSLHQWREFEPWLNPLRAALGPLLETYAG